MIVAGQSLDLLTVVAAAGRAADGHQLWECVCECGRRIMRQSNNLQSAGVKSCGCAQRILQTKHGMRSSPEYASWQAAKKRCVNPDDKDYPRYGGRGIVMCEAWLESFETFFKDMGHRPSGTTLDRVDTNGPYCLENCRWATGIEQSRNRRNSIFVEWRGCKRHLSEVAAEIGISYGAAFMRLKRGKLQ